MPQRSVSCTNLNSEVLLAGGKSQDKKERAVNVFDEPEKTVERTNVNKPSKEITTEEKASKETTEETNVKKPSHETIEDLKLTKPSHETIEDLKLTKPSHETIEDLKLTKPSKETVEETNANKEITEEAGPSLRTVKSEYADLKRHGNTTSKLPITPNDIPDLGQPKQEEVDAKTEEMPSSEDPDMISDADLLSDFTDGNEDIQRQISERTASRLTTFYYRIQPLIKNKEVRFCTIINLFLFLVNIILLLSCIVIGTLAVVYGLRFKEQSVLNRPCMYEFGEWSSCSAECVKPGQHLPFKSRMVNPETIVQARGDFIRLASCPVNVEFMTEIVPCNTHFCPINLSSIPFKSDLNKRHCWPIDPLDDNSECYTIRNIIESDQAILVDVTNLTKPCNCSTNTYQ